MRKEVRYEVWGTVYPGGKERETANCSCCGEVCYSEMTSKNISSYKLDEDGNPDRRKIY
jgi:hypothetical protein